MRVTRTDAAKADIGPKIEGSDPPRLPTERASRSLPRRSTLKETPKQTRSRIPGRRRQQVLWSIPAYWAEMRSARSVDDIIDWLYYKFPGRFALRSYPTQITLELTNECNFGCPHCQRTYLNKNRELGFMSPALLGKIAKESAGRLAELKIVGLGEAALHPQLDSMMGMLRDQRIRTRIYTNGTLFERYTPKEIAAWRLCGLVVSIDGTDEQSFKRLRLGGDYQAVRDDVKAFRAFRDATLGHRCPVIEIRHVIMPSETPAMLREFTRDWTRGLGDVVKFNLLGPPFDRRARADIDRSPCRDIRRELHIRWDGRVPLCGYSGDREWIGDVNDTLIAEIWRAVRLESVRDQHLRRDYSSLSFCTTCQHR